MAGIQQILPLTIALSALSCSDNDADMHKISVVEEKSVGSNTYTFLFSCTKREDDSGGCQRKENLDRIVLGDRYSDSETEAYEDGRSKSDWRRSPLNQKARDAAWTTYNGQGDFVEIMQQEIRQRYEQDIKTVAPIAERAYRDMFNLLTLDSIDYCSVEYQLEREEQGYSVKVEGDAATSDEHFSQHDSITVKGERDTFAFYFGHLTVADISSSGSGIDIRMYENDLMPIDYTKETYFERAASDSSLHDEEVVQQLETTIASYQGRMYGLLACLCYGDHLDNSRECREMQTAYATLKQE